MPHVSHIARLAPTRRYSWIYFRHSHASSADGQVCWDTSRPPPLDHHYLHLVLVLLQKLLLRVHAQLLLAGARVQRARLASVEPPARRLGPLHSRCEQSLALAHVLPRPLLLQLRGAHPWHGLGSNCLQCQALHPHLARLEPSLRVLQSAASPSLPTLAPCCLPALEHMHLHPHFQRLHLLVALGTSAPRR